MKSYAMHVKLGLILALFQFSVGASGEEAIQLPKNFLPGLRNERCSGALMGESNAGTVPATARTWKIKLIGITKIDDVTDVVRFSKPPGFVFKAGEAVNLSINTEAQGVQTRTMSIASSPSQDYLEFGMHVSNSAFKTTLMSLNDGDQIQVSAPFGSLNFQPDKPAVFIAGGVGITPFMSILRDPSSQNSQITLVYANAQRSDVPFFDELHALAKTHPKLTIIYLLNEATADAEFVTGTIDKNLLAKFVSQTPAKAIYYTVGSPNMVAAMKVFLAALGVPVGAISADM